MDIPIRTAMVTTEEDTLPFPDVEKVDRTEQGYLRLLGKENRLVAEFAPGGWRAWRWAPLVRQTQYEGNFPGQLLIDGKPIPAYKPDELPA